MTIKLAAMSALMVLALIGVPARADCTRSFRVPYDKLHESHQPGYDVLERVLTQMGCKIEKHYLEATIARHHRELAEGKLDILAEGSRLPEREKYAWFSLPYREEEVLLIAHRGNERLKLFSDLNSISSNRLRLIIDEHAWWGPEIAQRLPQWKSQQLAFPISEVGAGYAELNNRRGDLLLSTDEAFVAVAPVYPALYIFKSNVHKESVHFMFSRKSVSRDEVDQFNTILVTLMPKR